MLAGQAPDKDARIEDAEALNAAFTAAFGRLQLDRGSWAARSIVAAASALGVHPQSQWAFSSIVREVARGGANVGGTLDYLEVMARDSERSLPEGEGFPLSVLVSRMPPHQFYKGLGALSLLVDEARAAEYYRHAQGLAPDDLAILHPLAFLEQKLGRPDCAAQASRKAIEVHDARKPELQSVRGRGGLDAYEALCENDAGRAEAEARLTASASALD